MNLAMTTIVGYVAMATFLFWYIPYITRNRQSLLWLPSRGVCFLFGDGMTASVIGLIVQVVVPGALVCWATVSILHTIFPV